MTRRRPGRRPHALSLAGTVVAVTGGGRGIGAAITAAAAEQGARVAVGDLDRASAEETARQAGPRVSGHALDVTSRAGFAAFLDAAEEAHGPVDVVINNAGIMVVSDFLDEDPALADRQLDINLRAVIHGTREAATRMRARGSGQILNVASAAGRIGFVGVASYCAGKYGVVGLSEAVRRELHGTGVHVTCVLPGVVATDLTAGMDEHLLLRTVTPEYVARRVVGALHTRQPMVYAPRSLGLYAAASGMVPARVMDAAMRTIGGDHLMLRAAHSPARAEYSARITSPSEPTT